MTSIEGYRLSSVQLREWERGGGGQLTARVRFASPADRRRLQEALAVIAGRHEVLRLRLLHYPGVRVPLQGIDEEARVELGDGTPGDADLRTDGPLFSADLVDRSDGGQDLVLRASTLLTDATGLRILLDELASAYGSRPWHDDPDRLQFLDVSEWLLEQAEGRPAPAAAGDISAVTRLALSPTQDGPAGGTGVLDVQLDSRTAGGVHRLARTRGDTVPSLILASWALALSRHAETEVEGAVLALGVHGLGRSLPGTESVVGPLENCAVVGIPLPLPPAPKQFLDIVGQRLTGVTEAAALAGPAPAGDLAASFSVRDVAEPSPWADLVVREVNVEEPPPVAPLDLRAEITPQALGLRLTYDADRYGRQAAQLLLDATVAILTTLVDGHENERALRVCGDEESALLERWSTEKPAAGAPDTLVRAFDAAFATAAEGTEAVVSADGTVTFAELDRAASALAARIVASGVAPEDRVAVIAERSWRTVAAMVGVMRAGAVYVPLDPSAPTRRLTGLLRAVDARLVLAGASEPVAAGIAEEFPVLVPETADAFGPKDAPVLPAVEPHHAAYVIFTSGSTGTPRPVVVEHRAVAHLLAALEETVYAGTGPGLRVAVNAPLTFDASIKQLIQSAAGRTLCLVPEETRHDSADLLRYFTEQRVDVFDCTPSHLRLILDAVGADTTGTALPHTLLVGGEAIDKTLWEALAALDGVRGFNVYGPTECTVDVTIARVTADTKPTIGRPLPGTRVLILDQYLRQVPAGVAGELCIAGPQVARGYLGDAEATARRFVSLCADSPTQQRIYRTGDRARFLPDGRLAYLGRSDHQVKIRGFRVEPDEVAVVLGGHPAVAQALVVAHEDPEGTRLVGYARPETAAAAMALDLDRVAGINPHETKYLYDEIFTQGTYLRGGVTLRENAVVFDVGANIGMFSLYTHLLCPSASVYAFEPLAPVFACLRRNVEAFSAGVKTFEYGLAASDEELSFTYYPGYSMMSGASAYADPASEVEVIKRYLANERDQGLTDRDTLLAHADELLDERFRGEELRTRVRKLSDVIDEEGIGNIDLLKIDVQRAELDVLRGIDARHWPSIQQVVMEVHDCPGTTTEGRLADIVALLEAEGFTVTAEQDGLLEGTDRHSLHAVRPQYADDPRPVLADAGTGAPLDGTALRGWLAERLPAHLIPGAVVMLDSFPLNANGKIDRAALPQPFEPDRRGAELVLPRTPTEEVLAAAWREVLAVDEVSVEDDFFGLGGDSIRAIQVQVAAARRGLGVQLRDILSQPTISALGRTVDSAATEPSAAR
ncbi:amino acid adenylation domain-containing protein [Streptomyces syringium]|uniref:amino acid adenylation domain-containing protein n=1 Tax=Streptomyces syringium TaxID=76729 RepID=UPI003D947E54